MAARNLSINDLLARVGDRRAASTIYRILSRQTQDPRVSTLAAVCHALRISPNELLQHSGLWPGEEPARDTEDLRLEEALDSLKGLDPPLKQLAVSIIEAVILPLRGWQDSGGRFQPPR